MSAKETPETILAKIDDVHPTMVPSYLAEADTRLLLEIRDLLRLIGFQTLSPGLSGVPAPRDDAAWEEHAERQASLRKADEKLRRSSTYGKV